MQQEPVPRVAEILSERYPGIVVLRDTPTKQGTCTITAIRYDRRRINHKQAEAMVAAGGEDRSRVANKYPRKRRGVLARLLFGTKKILRGLHYRKVQRLGQSAEAGDFPLAQMHPPNPRVNGVGLVLPGFAARILPGFTRRIPAHELQMPPGEGGSNLQRGGCQFDPGRLHSIRLLRQIIPFLAVFACTAALAAAADDSAHAANPFFIGVYVYEYRLAAVAQEQGRDYFDVADEHFKILHEHGVNAIYLGGTTRERFDGHLRLAARHDMRLIPQLDFAYFQPGWSDEQIATYAKTAGEFIHRHRDEPRVIAWSVREEVPASAVDRLARYYAAIRSHAPGARFNIVHNSIDAARAQPEPHAAVFGTDRYAFWFEVSGGGYLASPSFALDWTRREAAGYHDEAARRGADFMLVVTQGGLLMPRWANEIVQDVDRAGVPGDERERRQVRERVMRFADQGRMGWRRFERPGGAGGGAAGGAGDVRYNMWKYYRLPPNCMKALAWTSVLEGAKLFFVWSYTPPTNNDLALGVESSAVMDEPPHEVHWMTLAGRPGVANTQLAELAEASGEIRAYASVITRMTKVGDSPVRCAQPGVHLRAFSVPGMTGRVVVIHNANVGRWPHDSRHFFSPDDDIRIDDEGNLVGYEPHTEPLAVKLIVANDRPIVDVRTGERLVDGVVRIAPGSGTLVFMGHPDEAERLRSWLKPPK